MRNAHCRPGVWRENRKSWKKRNTQGRTSNMVRNAQKRGKREMHTVGPGIWRETLKIMENEKCTL